MQCPQISDEKKSFASLTNNFWSFKKRIKKNIHQWGKTCFFFHQKSEGIAFTFCRYLYQNMRAFIFCRYCPPIVFCPQIWKTKKSSKIKGNTLGILRRSFFPFNALGMPSFNNSVCFVELETCSKWCVILFISIRSSDVKLMSEKIFCVILSAPTPTIFIESKVGVLIRLIVTFIIIFCHEICRWTFH